MADPTRVKWLGSLFSACLYAGWVAYSARGQTPGQMLLSATGQWLLSFIATFAFSALINRLVGDSRRYPAAARAGATAMLLYAGALFAVHGLLGTPHPLATLLPVLLLAGGYAFVFAGLQVRHNLGVAT
ncbi:hypothetical protein [Pseudomonas carassii]|uniref:Uncharacterized protein n=1 Tax=Pseudomonas carassii TaxID=3115855 RepID=A0ABU7H7Q1_9PSED|nr:hypothetical protein [Pseudomonas sp. 137P]MEE1886606.1 hypothetical protein [Pseudomonas sp. 137P]